MFMVGDGSTVITFGTVRDATVAVSAGEERIEPDGFAEVGDGEVEVALVAVCNAPQVVSPGAISRRFSVGPDDGCATGNLHIGGKSVLAPCPVR
jgi:hypothetical protein